MNPSLVMLIIEAIEAHWRHQHQHVELALDVLKEHLQLAIDGSGIALWDWLLPEDTITVNERWAAMLGYGPAELTSLNLDRWKYFVHPADLPQVERALGEHLDQSTAKYQCELRLRHCSGDWIWVLDQGRIVNRNQDGQPLRMTGTTLDISDRKRTELRLALQSAILERIAKSAPLQEILAALVQATEAQLDGSLCSILICGSDEKLYPAAAPSLPQAYNQALVGTAIGEAMGSCGTAAQRRQLVIVEDIATDPLWQDFRDLALAHGLRACWSIPVFPEQGAVLATFAVYYRQARRPHAHELETIQLVANLTQIAIERDRTDRTLEHLNQELEVRVQQRTVALHHREDELRQMNQELLRATRLKDEFLANMSHELRTPLNAILGMAEGLQEHIFGEINDQQFQALETIQDSGNHLLALINDILDLATIESGQIKLDHSSVAVAALCQSSLAFVEPQALKKRIHLDLQLPPHPLYLWVDERRMRQVLINLLNNAVKFTPEAGQVTLAAQVLEGPATVPTPPATVGPPCLRLAISDTGIGIDPSHLDQLFQPFVQIDSALNRQFQGTGLGLALVKQIVVLHGGQVKVTSRVGEGSCFTVDLPLSSAMAPLGPGVNPGLAPLPPTSETSILLVAGQGGDTHSLVSYLRAKGYTLVLAEAGEAAIARAEAQPFSLILLDLDLPTQDNLDMMAQMAAVTHQRQVPIIVLGASVPLAKSAPSDTIVYVPKPVQLKPLMTKIQHLLSCSRNTR